MGTENLYAYRAVSRSFLDVAKPRDSIAWNYRELTTLLNLCENLAEVGFNPLTMRSTNKNLTTELP